MLEEAARATYRDFTQSPHLEPPYALRTVFWRLEIVAYCRGRSAGIYNHTPSSVPNITSFPAVEIALDIHQEVQFHNHRTLVGWGAF